MMKEDLPIDELFRNKLNTIKIESEDSGWMDIDSALTKSRFYRFGFHYFNIYYASLICFCFIFSMSVLVKNFFKEESQSISPAVENNVEIPGKDSKQSLNSDFNEGRVNKAKEPSGNTGLLKSGTIKPKSNSEPGKDSLEYIPAKPLDNPINSENNEAIISGQIHNQEEEDEKQTIYITKQDTLIIVDTLKVNKKRQKRK